MSIKDDAGTVDACLDRDFEAVDDGFTATGRAADHSQKRQLLSLATEHGPIGARNAA
jgi:hypothetical protein